MINVRPHLNHWRVWKNGTYYATIRHEGDTYTCYDRAGRPLARSRHWHRVKTWAKQHYTLGD